MPVHDWSHVDANLFHDFHQAWTIAIRNALNGGLLPKGYSALVDQRAGGVAPDVIAVKRRGLPTATADGPRGGRVMTSVTPQSRHVLRAEREVPAPRANRVVIHHRLGEVVCVVEIVSPGNKGSRSALRSFVQKAADLLQQGVHLLIVDLFPPTKRDPQGIHKALWDEIDDQPFELPPEKPLTLAAYVSATPKVAYVEPVGVGDALPDMPAYLDEESWVPVPLEATYQATWSTCPEDVRDIVLRGDAALEE